ncbi:monovalent cation/H(+) antiporter subunit G [Xylophilus sp. ASV27]|uniref:monovalent cation/H(+) antiporter subunit G n=1 Tax=Xylophilus sp. ASV27 TaxID=2795129 RepID=UPI0018EDFDBE|nr:monovalent cation/H(+) antiporter subunit G [Xylophilus sp. ASV27]
MTPAVALPFWAEVLVGLLALLGSAMALLGSVGVLRLGSFFQRIHATTLGATLGCWSLVAATIVYFSARASSLSVHALLIAIFVALTVPVTTIFLMRAALFRARRAGRTDVPEGLSDGLPDGDPSQ